ncbi:MAG: hypothetical protein ACF8XB_16920 [Planctomycetota bacterium JB042]
MRPNPTASLLLAASAVALVGCGDDPAPADLSDATAGVQNAGTRALDEDSVNDYLAALKDLRESGLGPNTELGDDASGVEAMASGFAMKGEWEDVLDDHDLDGPSFMAIHVGLAKAFGRMMLDEKNGEIEAQQQEAYEKMKEAMGEEAAQKMLDAQKQALGQAAGMFGDVPPEHVELVREMREEIEAAWQSN